MHTHRERPAVHLFVTQTYLLLVFIPRSSFFRSSLRSLQQSCIFFRNPLISFSRGGGTDLDDTLLIERQWGSTLRIYPLLKRLYGYGVQAYTPNTKNMRI